MATGDLGIATADMARNTNGLGPAFRRGDGLTCIEEPGPEGPLFVLVHGTWARNAPWATAGASLPSKLRDEWPHPGIFAFKWRGLNRLTERLRASEELQEAIRRLKEQFTGRQIIVIGHSHGGNIVAWATTQIEIDAAVYLNTPFLRVLELEPLSVSSFRAFGVPSPFDRIDLIAASIQLFGVPLLLVITVALIVLSSVFAPDADWIYYLRILTSAFTIGLSYFLLQGSHLLSERIRSYRRTLVTLTTGPRLARRELVVSATGDEALTALTTANATISVFGTFTRRPLIWMTQIGRYIDTKLGGMSLIFGVIVLLALGIFATMLAVAMLAYGPIHGLIAAESTLATTAFPSGITDTMSVDVGPRGLKHSLVYDSPEVIAAIIRWLKKE